MSGAVAVDDGRAMTRLAWFEAGRLHTHALPSRAESGLHYGPCGVDGHPVVARYHTEGEWWTVGEVGQAESTGSTTYPLSGPHRAVIHHGLRQSGIEPDLLDWLVVLGETMADPPTIEARRHSLARPVRAEHEAEPVSIAEAAIQIIKPPLAAWADHCLDEDGRVRVSDDVTSIAFVDIGLRATRSWVVEAHTGAFLPKRSQIKPLGVITAAHGLRCEVERAFAGGLHWPLPEALKCLSSGQSTLVLFGARFEAREAIAHGLDALARSVTTMPALADRVVYLGGGAALLADRLPAASVAPQPAEALVRGALRIANTGRLIRRGQVQAFLSGE